MNRRQPEALPLLGRRILVADDSSSTRLILQGILERAGASVTQVPDGTDVLERMRSASHPYDAVVLDVVMDRLGGFEAARRIRALPRAPNSALVFMSAHIDGEVKEFARQADGYCELLAKPLEPAEVVRIVSAVLGQATEVPVPGDHPAGLDLPGCELGEALERCGGDRSILLRFQGQLLEDIGPRLSIASQALRGRLYRIARDELHRVRGDVLNLGFREIGSRLAAIQGETSSLCATELASPDGTLPSGFMDAGERLADTLAEVTVSLTGLVARVARLPAMAAAVPSAAPTRWLDGAGLAELVLALEQNALAAVRQCGGTARVLPERYSSAVDADFRARVARLDFPGALQLLGAADRSRSLATTGSGYNILVVDDVPSAVLVLFGMIGEIGVVRFALTAEHAMEIAETVPPDIVIVDVHLGGTNGIELCRRLKSTPATADAAVILVSADGNISMEVEGLTAGAADFLSKPLNKARVIGRVNAQLAGMRRMSVAAAAIARDASSAMLGYVTSTYAGAIIDVSPRILRQLSAGGESWSRRALREMFEPASTAAVDRALREIADTGHAVPFEALLSSADSTPVPVRVVGRSAPGVSSRIAWLSVEDRRDRLSSEHRWLDDELSRKLGAIAGGIAHEFNNLLNIAIGNIDLALEFASPDPTQRDRLSRASGALMRAAEISGRLGEFSLRGERSEALQSLDQLLDQIWLFVVSEVPAGVIVLRERAAEEVPLRLDTRGVRAAITNLLQNAYDAMPAGGQVVVRSRVRHQPVADGTVALLEVVDSGHGMTDEVRHRVFEPFFTTRAPNRIGLGLTQVRGFVQRNHASIEIQSARGASTTVRIEFNA